MRRFLSSFLLVLAAALATPGPAGADGLYVGHGRRSIPPWSARINVSGGLHGASDPFHDDFYSGGYHWYEFGGYGAAGLEIHTGYGNSIELYGMYRAVEDEDAFVAYPWSGSASTVFSAFDIEAWSFGATLRHYEFRGRGGAYFGAGGGFVQSESSVREIVDGRDSFAIESDDAGAEIHALVGFEGRFAPSIMVGLEIGYRHAFLDEPDDFSGAVIGLRMGLLMGP